MPPARWSGFRHSCGPTRSGSNVPRRKSSTPIFTAQPLCSPLNAADEALATFPDCLILSAGEDSLREDTEAFALRLVKAGVCVTAQRIPEAMHGFTTNRTPGWERALALHCKFFQEHL